MTPREVESLSVVSTPEALRAAMRSVPGWARGKVRWVCSWLDGRRVGWDEAREIVRGAK